MQAICKRISSKMIYCLKGVTLQKGILKMISKCYFTKIFALISKDCVSNPNPILIMQAKPLLPNL
jgi:hypothetical protein